MIRKPLWSLAGLALACLALVGCGHGAGYRKPYHDTPNTGLGTPPAHGAAQTRAPANPNTGFQALGTAGGTTSGTTQGASITPAGLTNPGTPNASAGKPYNNQPGNSAFKAAWDQTPPAPPRQPVATSPGVPRPTLTNPAPTAGNQGYVIPSPPTGDKPAADPSVRSTIAPMAPFNENKVSSAPTPAVVPQAPAPSQDWK